MRTCASSASASLCARLDWIARAGADDVVVRLTIDERGSVVDYSILNDVNSKLRNDIANMILFTKFQPATEFGVPIGGKMLVSFRRIVVKG